MKPVLRFGQALAYETLKKRTHASANFEQTGIEITLKRGTYRPTVIVVISYWLVVIIC